MGLRRNSLELRDGVVKFVLSDFVLSDSCSPTWHATLEMSPVYVFTRLPRRFGVDGRLPLPCGLLKVCPPSARDEYKRRTFLGL
jgi:hypothetical protein